MMNVKGYYGMKIYSVVFAIPILTAIESITSYAT